MVREGAADECLKIWNYRIRRFNPEEALAYRARALNGLEKGHQRVRKRAGARAVAGKIARPPLNKSQIFSFLGVDKQIILC